MRATEIVKAYLFEKKGIKKALKNIQGLGGDEWIRTTDSRIFSPMLYQLSYITL